MPRKAEVHENSTKVEALRFTYTAAAAKLTIRFSPFSR